jgi:hypothetical protein
LKHGKRARQLCAPGARVGTALAGATTAIASNTTVYTAANGDQLFVSWTGTATSSGPDNTFSGPETITGGTGRFAGAAGSNGVSGTASVVTMTGQFTSVRTISY